MTALEWAGFVVGVLIVLATSGSVLRTLVVPRGLASRLTAFVSKWVKKSFLAIANRFDNYESKDSVLALQAPTFLLVLLLTWMLLLLLGYALMLWPLVDLSFTDALIESGSSMLTLGFAATFVPGATAVYFAAAITGLVIVALQIAYLPTLYSAFNRRETLVTLLQSRAGAPAWGPEILMRHTRINSLDRLPELYSAWEVWAADVDESHTNYPALIWFRSPHPLRSWVVALLAVMDSAALYLALSPGKAPTEARMCLRMGFLCLQDVARRVGAEFDPDPFPEDPIELTYEDFHGAYHLMQQEGFPIERLPEEAWPHFRGWRVNYETVAYALADAIVAPPGPWSGPRSHLPGMAILPQRPVDRRPDEAEQKPKLENPAAHA